MLQPNKRILTSALGAVAVFGLWAADTPGQQTPVIRVDTRLVVLPVTVVDKTGHLVVNLPETAFQVFENGVPQVIKVFKREDVPVSMGLVIDNSGSMRDKRAKVEADAVALCDAIGHPNVGILFDTFHANIEEKDVAAAYRLVGRHLKHVHTCENDRGIPGTGHLDWPGVFQALRDVHYDGWLTIESFGFALGELSAAASIWRDIAPSPESIAFEGVKFLKRGMA